MRPMMLSLFLSLVALAQEPPGPPPGEHRMPPPKNLKILKPDEVMPAMRSFTVALGVKCDFCHVRGDFASDEKHHKEIARGMLEMTHQINTHFPDGKMHVSCYTCHRGAEEPAMRPPEGEPPPHP
ncbi:MAG: c-type cytochrome [Bryobacteraceae bacterium]